MSTNKQYSKEDLANFKIQIEQLLINGKAYLHQIKEQIQDQNENAGHESDWIDNAASTTELALLFTIEDRQLNYLSELEEALTRIRDQTYGICILTGELIDRRRLKAVPTTNKSLMAKINTSSPTEVLITNKSIPSSETQESIISSKKMVNKSLKSSDLK